ncbi:hypothetical protein RND81_08G004400 [Saponaria officinalis]|uniref:Pre-mRNA-processing factor 39 n=1 Tax=Saponaria officinalis TaxID=3572 RepID=A0AAW1J2W2_SAPOF
MEVESNDNSSKEFQLDEVVAQVSMDFEAWIALLSTVELMYNDDIDKISLVYDSFLSEFPLCYGYWKKYAEHYARLRSVENVVQIFERAVEAVPYSVGVWVDYCSFGVSSFEDPSDVCRLFERGLSFVGKDYICNLLWDKYIEFEFSQQHWDSLANIYIRTLKFPTKKLHHYYENFKKLVSIWEEETGLQEGSHTVLQSKGESEDETMMLGDAEIFHVISDLLDPSTRMKALRKYISAGELFYRKACDLDLKLQKLEQNIRRPYFHVKPLDDSQLHNWHQYLDLIEMEGDFDWAVKLYERCLVSCAYYPEFWMRYVDFVESKGGKEIAVDALDRATNIFLKNSPEIHLFNAWFKEKIGDIDGAHTAVLQCDHVIGPHFVDMVRRKANMEKRVGNNSRACDIYKEALDLAAAKRPDTLPVLCVHYARLQYMITNSVEAAREVLLNGIQRVPHSKLLLKELLSFSSMHDGAKQVDLLDSLIAQTLSAASNVSGALSTKDREEISTLYMEFVDSCGSIHDIRRAWNRHLKLFPHLIRVPYSLKKSAKVGDVLKMLAEGKPDFFDLHLLKISVENDGNPLIQPPNPNEKLEVAETPVKNDNQPMNGQGQSEHGDEGLDCLETEHLEASKSHIKAEGKKPSEAVEECSLNGVQKQQKLMDQQEKPTSHDGKLINSHDDKSLYVSSSKTPAVDAPPEAFLRRRSSPTEDEEVDVISLSSPVRILDKDGIETCNESSRPSTQRHKNSPSISSPTRRLDREGSRVRPCSSSKGRSEYGSRSPENSRDRRERSLSPRRRGSHGYSDNRYHRQRSLSPRRNNSRWHSDDRWHRDRHQRRYSRYQDNPRGQRDGRRQNQQILLIDNKGQSFNAQHQVIGSAPQGQIPVQPVMYPQPQLNQLPLPNNEQPNNEQYMQNPQLYNQMWQYYYQQQQLLLQQQQQQPVSQPPQPNQMPPLQQLQQQVQNPDQQQTMPTHQQTPGQVVPNQQQLLQLHYQQQQLYQQPQLQQQQQQTDEQTQLPPQQLYQALQIQQQEQQKQVPVQQQPQMQQQSQLQLQQQEQQKQVPVQQQPQMQQQSQLQLQQSYQYQQQQYILYLQQLHQYQQSQQQPGLVQDQKLTQQQGELPEKQQDQKMLPKSEELSSQKDDVISQDHEQNHGIDVHASTSEEATGRLKSQDELPEIE